MWWAWSSPPELLAQQDGMDALHPSTLEHFSVWDSVLPFVMEQGPEASNVDGIKLFSLPAVDCPCLTHTEQTL